jgi:hypothetical protein
LLQRDQRPSRHLRIGSEIVSQEKLQTISLAALNTLGEHLVGLPNRSKSFGDLFGVFSSSHASKYNTGSRRVHGHPNISHHSGPLHSTVPPNNRNLDGTSAFWDADKLAAWKQQQRRIQDLEAEMDAFWRLEQVIESKHVISI